MKKLLITLCLLSSVFVLAQEQGGIPDGINELLQQNNAGYQEFKVVKTKSVIGTGIMGIAAQKVPLPLIESFKSDGAAVLIIEEDFVDRCPDQSNMQSGLNMWVMHLDEANPYNSFTTSAKDKRASLQIRGMMDRYEPGPNYCQDLEMVKVESGLGAMTASFSTYIHTTPRSFQVLEQANMNTEKMKQLKAVQEFWQANVIGYLQYMKEYQAKPHITRIGGNGTADPPPPAKKEKVKAGTEDGEEEEGWFSERDGFAIAKHVVDALSTSLDVMELANNGAQLFGAALKYGGSVKKAALDLVASAANLAGLDISSMSEEQIYKTMDMMVAAFAKANEKYAKKGDPTAQQLQRKAKIPVDDDRFYNEAVDAGQMLYQLNDLFNSLDAIEDEFEDYDYPEGAVSGKVYGPGLYQNLTSLKNEGQPIIQIATSTALQENKKMASPEMLNNLKAMGYNIPDEVLNMDIDAKIAEAQAMAEGKVDIDLNEPVFNGILSTTHTITLQGNTFQNFQIIFAVSSPNEPIDDDWMDANTIFDGSSIPNDDDEKPKSKTLYLATNGSDSNPGTEMAPFATMQKALDEAQIHRQNRKQVTIIVKDGTYKQSAEVNWSNSEGLPFLNIESQNKHKAIFIGTERVSEKIKWLKNGANGYYTTKPPLHPKQWFYTPGGNPMDNPAPVLSVNGIKLNHLAMDLPPGLNGIYSFSNNKVLVAVPEGVLDLNAANVEVSTRKFAIKFEGGGGIKISGLRLLNYPYPVHHNTPGIAHEGNIQVMGCKFQ